MATWQGEMTRLIQERDKATVRKVFAFMLSKSGAETQAKLKLLIAEVKANWEEIMKVDEE